MIAAILLAPLLSACAPVVGGGVLVAVVAIGALTSHCYDYVDVTVFDPQGRKTCAATVTASNGGSEFELTSCYYAPLTDGHWTIRARLPGLQDAVSQVDVEHANDCTRHVQSMELTLGPVGVAPAAPVPRLEVAPPPLPATPANALPPPPPAPPSFSAAPPNSPPPSGPPTPASAAPAASSAPPSVGVFPDEAAHPSPPK